MESKISPMETSTRAITSMGNRMARESTIGETDPHTKESF